MSLETAKSYHQHRHFCRHSHIAGEGCCIVIHGRPNANQLQSLDNCSHHWVCRQTCYNHS